MRNRLFFGLTVARLATFFLVVQLLSFGLGLTIMYSFARGTIIGDTRRAVEAARNDLLDDYRQDGLDRMRGTILARLGSEEYRDLVIYVRKPDGSRLVGNLPKWPKTLGTTVPWQITDLTRDGASSPERVGIAAVPLGKGYALLTGEVMENETRLTRAMERSLLWAMVAGSIMAGIAALGVARILERRIDAFTGVARDVEHGNLAARVERSGAGDAFDRLGVAMNAMLDRIERLVQELRVLTDTMAHDLRSPISRMKATLERSIGQTRDPAALAALGQSIEEADGVHRLLSNALQISRAEAGMGRDQFAEFELIDLANDLAEIYGPLAEDAGFSISVYVAGQVPVRAHRDFLVQALTNLIENALKHATGGSQIILGGAVADSTVQLWVADDGPGIPPEQMAEALRRYGRLDPARTQAGAGLGLSLVETIAHLHGGEMIAEANTPQGLRVTLAMPISRQI